MPEVRNYGPPRSGGGGLPNVQPAWGAMNSGGYGPGGGGGGGFGSTFARANIMKRRRMFQTGAERNMPQAGGRPGDSNYFVPDDSLYGDKSFNTGNIYGSSMPGTSPPAGGLPGMSPVTIGRGEWAGMTPEAQQNMRGAPQGELQRLSDAFLSVRGGRGRGMGRSMGMGQGYGEGYPGDALKRLLEARLGGGF